MQLEISKLVDELHSLDNAGQSKLACKLILESIYDRCDNELYDDIRTIYESVYLDILSTDIICAMFLPKINYPNWGKDLDYLYDRTDKVF